MNSETVEKYLDYYGETQGLLPEKLEKFREAYSEKGFLTREQLYELAFHSSTRSAYHVRKNPEQRCRDVTANILKLEDDFSQIALIEALKGFKAPTASVILTVKDPERHAVVDTRVWASLERFGYLEGRKESFTADDYVRMIEPMREIAKETSFTTEEIGYALFAMDVEKREGNLH